MAFETRVRLPVSQTSMPLGARVVGQVPDGEEVRVTLILKRKAQPDTAVVTGAVRPLSRAEFAARFGSDDSAHALIEDFAKAFQLRVIESDPAKRRVILSGPASAISQAFGVRLNTLAVPETSRTFRAAAGQANIPSELAPVLEAVLGLDTRPVVSPRSVINNAAVPVGFYSPQVAGWYNFPRDANGAGQTIGILQFGGGFGYADLEAYFASLGLRLPSVTAVSVDNATNSPGSRADLEVMLDIEVAGAVANGAKLAVYFAPNSEQGFTNAILDAIHDAVHTPSVISISWGAAEDSWTAQGRTAINSALQDAAALGITVTVAAGDTGSTDGQGDNQFHVDFPASSPFVLGCGGTSVTPSGTGIASEVVWNNSHGATGGGVSLMFARPTYQDLARVPVHPRTGFTGRGLPDVAGNADPATGYRIRMNDADTTAGGTSAVAPLWAGLIAILNQKSGRRLGFINQALYAMGEAGFRDVVSGSNDSAGIGAYFARPGWDACTGLGTPNAAALLSRLQSGGSGTPPSGGTSNPPGGPPRPPPPDDGIPFPWNF